MAVIEILSLTAVQKLGPDMSTLQTVTGGAPVLNLVLGDGGAALLKGEISNSCSRTNGQP